MKAKLTLSVIVLTVVVLVGANYQQLFKSLVPPNPVIVSTAADASSSRLFDYSLTLKASVRNTGGDGYVALDATVYQSGKSWNKTTSIYIESYETKNVELVFEEVRLLQSTPKYHVSASAIGY